MDDPLSLFSPYVGEWFRRAYSQPTPPQAQGWPAIARGDHTLVLAPTGSGKTLTAFLWGLDVLYRDLLETPEPERQTRDSAYVPGVRVLYVSPLKALNNDVERNLQVPLAGIQATARTAGAPLPAIRVAVRTGDTPANERGRMTRRPPHILITTPESLYLLLTSERARAMFATVHTVVVDEIHTVAGSKRGAHLAVSLERLDRLSARRVQRIGLSATVRPLETAARFLGGQDQSLDFAPRPVTVVDAAYRKPLDLRVVTVVDDFRNVPGSSIWSAIVPEVDRLVEQHRTTLIFCNNRRLAERAADRLNEHRLFKATSGDPPHPPAPSPTAVPPLSPDPFLPPGEKGECRGERSTVPRPTTVPPLPLWERGSGGEGKPPRRGTVIGADVGMFAAGIDAGRLVAAGLVPIRAHHGSMSKATRLEMEQALKAGTLPALVATSSLELGIDVGEIDLAVQLQSPKSVSGGLQRVGRSGHLVGQTSVGRIFATHVEDVVESAAVAWGMLRGEIEHVETPENPLDVLAQHLLAMVSTEDWELNAAYALVRGAYPYRNLSEAAFRSVVELLAGKYPETVSRHLQPRLSWDRVNGKLAALPGSRFLAVQSAGTIPDRGTYAMVLTDRKTRVGELDEEFVFESRPGDTFLLGSQVWRVLEIDDDRVIAEPAPGEIPRMPFWKGDYPWRPYDLGKRIGAFRRRIVDLLSTLSPEDTERIRSLDENDIEAMAGAGATFPLSIGMERGPGGEVPPERSPEGEVISFLHHDCALDRNSIVQIVDYFSRQLEAVGQVATDRNVVVETFEDAVGDPRIVVHSPFGGRVNGAWAIALAGAIRERAGVEPQIITGDDGILLRFVNAGQPPPADLVARITSQEAKERLLAELPGSAVFGAQFRMNAARALLLPRQRAGKRTPLWLSRLKAKDLMQAVQGFDDFPITLETYRDCLRDVMDLDGLTEVLDQIQRGDIQVTIHESQFPSPVAAGLEYRMAAQYVYEYDAPRGERHLTALSLDRSLLADLLGDRSLADLLKPAAVADIAARVSRTGPDSRARSAEELAQIIYDLGDLSSDEIQARCDDSPLALSRSKGGPAGPSIGSGRAEGSEERAQGATGDPAYTPSDVWIHQLAAAGRIILLEIGGAPRWVHAERLADYDQLPHSPLPALRRWLMHAPPTSAAALARRYGLSEARMRECLTALAPDVISGEFTPGGGEQWVDRRTLEQMHRRTLTLLRKEVQPVPNHAYAEFLRLWQGVTPPLPLWERGPGGEGKQAPWERRSEGEASTFPLSTGVERGLGGEVSPEKVRAGTALNRTLQQLRGFAVPGVSYLRDVLPTRIAGFDTGLLAERCQSGEIMWVAEGGRDPRRARVSFFFRGEGGLFLARRPDPVVLDALDDAPRAAYEFLSEEGAALLADIADGAALDRPAAQAALVALVLAGLVTNDTLEALQAVLGYDAPAAARSGPHSSLETQLAARMTALPRRMTAHRMRDARRRAREAVFARMATPVRGGWIGRWSLVHRPSLLGKPLGDDERALRQARQLLARWGVVTRACLEREPGSFSWESLYPLLARLEMRGEVRRGYFVQGLPGVQFALPEVVEQLRAVNGGREHSQSETPVIALSAADPAQVFGSETHGGPLRFARLPSSAVALAWGEPVAVMEDSGASVSAVEDHPSLVPALRALAQWWAARQPGHQRLHVERWHGEPVLATRGVTPLEAAGFVRESGAMLWLA